MWYVWRYDCLMHPETISALKAHDAKARAAISDRIDAYAETAAGREAARAQADYEATAITQPSLPSAETVPLVTMTLTELHDTIYQAASLVLQQTSMTKTRAQALAARAGTRGQEIVNVHGWTHRGVDPRA